VHLDDENLHYEAVSYVWGDATKWKIIVCDGLNVSITQNLFEALQRFRTPDTMRTLWADAVCINQGDTSKRTSQVRVMGVIYRRATQASFGYSMKKTKWFKLRLTSSVNTEINSII